MFAFKALLIILGIDIPSPSPYIILFIIVALTAIVLLAKLPSLRKYKRKRNIIIYTILTLALVFTLFQAYRTSQTNLLEYYFNDRSKFPDYYPETTNQFNLTCDNDGDTANSFYMIINSVNASFPTQPHETYITVSDTAIKVLFTLEENGSPNEKQTKLVLFNINENVTGFSFRAHPENMNDFTFAGGLYAMKYVWNGTENCYKLGSALLTPQP